MQTAPGRPGKLKTQHSKLKTSSVTVQPPPFALLSRTGRFYLGPFEWGEFSHKKSMRDQYFFVEFQIGSQPRFDALRRFFLALKAEKDRFCLESNKGTGKNPEELNWYGLLDLEAVEWFSDTFDFESDEGKAYQQLWDLTDPGIRLAHPMFNLPGHWDFDSLIEALFEGEYVLIDMVQEGPATGVLYYDPWAAPFGGTESMVELIESFGNTVTCESWHEGPHRRRIVGWDFELAKKLVQAGKGFVPN